MPFVTGEAVPAGAQPVADTFEVTGINIRTGGGGSPGTVTVYWRKLLSLDGGGTQVVSSGAFDVPAGGLAGSYPDGGKTYYENLKGLAYGLLQDAGVFPKDGVLK